MTHTVRLALFVLGVTVLCCGVAAAAADRDTMETATRDRDAESSMDSSRRSIFEFVIRSDHDAIRTRIARFRADRSAATARPLIDLLTLHDRRERLILYPIASVLMDEKFVNDMRKDHNKMALALNCLRFADLTNTTVLHKLNCVTEDVLKHIKEEESNLLSTLSDFLIVRPRLTAVLVMKWRSITSTTGLQITELVHSEHINIRVLVAGYKMWALQAKMEKNNEKAKQMKEQMANALHDSLAAHTKCESAIFYPFVDKVLGNRATESLSEDHEKLNEMFNKMKNLNSSDRSFMKMLSKAVALEAKHMAKEEAMLPELKAHLDANHDECLNLANKMLKCQLANL